MSTSKKKKIQLLTSNISDNNIVEEVLKLLKEKNQSIESYSVIDFLDTVERIGLEEDLVKTFVDEDMIREVSYRDMLSSLETCLYDEGVSRVILIESENTIGLYLVHDFSFEGDLDNLVEILSKFVHSSQSVGIGFIKTSGDTTKISNEFARFMPIPKSDKL